MRVFTYFFICIILSFSFHSLIGQNVANNGHIASNSNTSSIASTSENLATGSMTSSIPIYELDLENSVKIPINLTYATGNGLPVRSRNGWVGMGWNLSSQFSISRNIRGADDLQDLLVWQGGPIGTYYDGFYNRPFRDGDVPSTNGFASGIEDSEPDIFTVNLIGQQITFYLSKVNNQTSEWKTIPANADVQIEFTLGDAEYGYDSEGININRYNSSFIITDGLGYKYYFGTSDYEEYSNTYNLQHYISPRGGNGGGPAAGRKVRLLTTKWYLEKIETPFTNQLVTFSYEDDFYSYLSGYSSLEKSISENSAMCPNSTHYHDYTERAHYTYVKGKRLASIDYQNTQINFVANTSNHGHKIFIDGNKRSRMLDSIIIYKNDNCFKKISLEYHNLLKEPGDDPRDYPWHDTESFNNYFLKHLLEIPCTSNLNDGSYDSTNSYTHEFSYIRQYEMQDISEYAYDYWGYYNGKNDNNSPIPETYDSDGDSDPCGSQIVGDRRPDATFAAVGLLDTIFNPYGGFTSFEYETNRALTNSIEEEILGSITGHYNNQTITHIHYCDNTADVTFIRERSEWEFVYTQEPDSYLKLENLAEVKKPLGCESLPVALARRTLHRKINGVYTVVPLGNGTFTIDMSGLPSGEYKVSYLSTPNSNVQLVKYQSSGEMDGGGVRIKSKYESDNDGHDYDDITTHYSYGDGHWGHDFLPSIYGYLNGDPIIPAINDNNISFDAQRSVISTLGRSIFQSFSSPVYYEEATITQTDVPGYTTYTFSVPDNTDENDRNRCAFYNNPSGTTPFINQNQQFISGGMTSYNLNNGIDSDLTCYDEYTSPFTLGTLLQTEVFNDADESVYSQINEYEEVNSNEHIYGVVCERYVEDKEFGFWFNEHIGTSWNVISRPYKVNTNTNRLTRSRTTIDGITTIVEYDYIADRNILDQKSSYVVGLETEEIVEEYSYLSIFPSALRNELQNRNCVSIPFKIETTRNNQLISGNSTSYILDNVNDNIVKEVDYSVVGGVFRPELKYAAWDNLGRPLEMYRVKLNGNVSAPVSGTNDANYDFPTVTTYNSINQYAVDNITRRYRTVSYQYYDNTQLQSIRDTDGETTVIQYDDLGRRQLVISQNGEHTLEAEYYVDPLSLNSYTKHTTTVQNSTIAPQISFEYYDGLGRKTSKSISEFNANGSDLVLENIAYNNTGNLHTVDRPGYGAVAFKYTNSPMQRPAGEFKSHIETTEILETYITHGSNENEITINGIGGLIKIFPANTLKKETQIDVEGRQTSQYYDQNGQVVRLSKNIDGTASNTDTYHNDLGQILSIASPIGESYEFSYHPATNLMVSKSVPGTDQSEMYWYDDLGNTVLSKAYDGTALAYIFDPYQRAVKSGVYKATLPPAGHIFTADIPNSDLYLSEERKYFGNYGESSFLEEEKLAILGNFTSINALNEINGVNPILKKNHTYDSENRLFQTSSNSHFGALDNYVYSYDEENKIIETKRIHTTPNGVTHEFVYENHYDDRSRNIGISLNGQRLSNVDYDQYNRVRARHLHQTGTDSYAQTINYKYDGYGRVTEINDIDDFVYADCSAERYCTILIRLTDEQGVTINSLTEAVGQSELPIGGMNFPYDIDQASEASIDVFISDLKIWLNTNNYAFDEIYYEFDDIPFIAITQSDAPLVTAMVDNGTRQMERVDCCSQIDEIDLFAQKITYEGSTISANEWQTSCGPLHSYHYHYDDIGRLTFANYSHRENSSMPFIGDALDDVLAGYNHTDQNGRYSTSYSYDHVGNFNKLTRNSIDTDSDFGLLVDNLVYTYNMNHTSAGFGRLLDVEDLSNNTTGFTAKNSSGGNSLLASYQYDQSGRVIENEGKDLNFEYNFLQNAKRIVSGINEVNVFYDANGKVIEKGINGNKTLVQLFDDDIEYRNNKIFAINHADGRARITPSSLLRPSLSFEYVIRDYKGNPRVRFTDRINDDVITADEILSVQNYYPYGLKWDSSPDPGNAANFQEYQNMDWLEAQNVYLTQHRVMDPEIGRWLQIDPLAAAATTNTPYGSMAMNPVMFTDENGAIAVETVILIASLVATVVEGLQVWHNIRAFNAANPHSQIKNGEWVLTQWALVEGLSYAITYGVMPYIKIPAVSEATKFTQKAIRGALKYTKHFVSQGLVTVLGSAIRGNGLYRDDGIQNFKDAAALLVTVAVSAAVSTAIDIAMEKTVFPKEKQKIREKRSQALESKHQNRIEKSNLNNSKTNLRKEIRAGFRSYNFDHNPSHYWSLRSRLRLVKSAWRVVGILGDGWGYATFQDQEGGGQNLAEYTKYGSVSFKHKWGESIIDESQVPGTWGWTTLPDVLNILISIP